MCSYALGQPEVDAEESRRLPGYREPATVRTFDAPEALDTRFYEVRPAVGPEQGAEGVADAVPLDDQPLPGLHPCLRFLLRPPHPHLPRLQRRPGLRARDRRQGQRARGRAGRAVRPSWKREHVALGTNTDPYQWVERRYKLMPGIWEAMRDSRHALLGAHQVAAAAARHRAVQADPRAPGSPPTSRSRRSTRRRGAPASRTRRIRASASRRWPSSTAPASRRAS